MNLNLVRDTIYSKSDDRAVFRLPKEIKKELRLEAKAAGYKSFSQYLLSIVLQRKK